MPSAQVSPQPVGDDLHQLYSIGDLAAEFAISPRAIRFYEDQDLLRPQRIGGNRSGAREERRFKQLR